MRFKTYVVRQPSEMQNWRGCMTFVYAVCINLWIDSCSAPPCGTLTAMGARADAIIGLSPKSVDCSFLLVGCPSRAEVRAGIVAAAGLRLLTMNMLRSIVCL